LTNRILRHDDDLFKQDSTRDSSQGKKEKKTYSIFLLCSRTSFSVILHLK